jgi:predicted transcriptional regulator YdeE
MGAVRDDSMQQAIIKRISDCYIQPQSGGGVYSCHMNSAEKIELPALRFAGLTARVSNAEPELIGDHWRRFHADETVTRIAGKANPNVFAVYTEYESDYTGAYTLLIGYSVEADAVVPGGLRVIEVPAQQYAVILASGEQPQATWAAWQWVWASALDRAYTADFDEYIAPGDVRLHVAVRS